MSFRAPISRIIRWSAPEGRDAGLEHCEIRPEDDRVIAAGAVIGEADGASFGLDYRLVVDAAWHVRRASLRTVSGTSLELICDGQGRWQVNGQSAPNLDGCIDIDIQASPLTNTLPIRRLDLKCGQSAVIRVLYINVPNLTVEAVNQRYTALGLGLYRFEGLDTSFTADLMVDEDGLVLNYPDLFRRLD
jgi:hypothetical protein